MFYYNIYFKPGKDIFYKEESSDRFTFKDIVNILTFSYIRCYSDSKSIMGKLSKANETHKLIALFSKFLFDYVRNDEMKELLKKNNFPLVFINTYKEASKKRNEFYLFDLIGRFTEVDSLFFAQNLTHIKHQINYNENGPFLVYEKCGPYMLKGFLPIFAYLIMLRDSLLYLESDFRAFRLFAYYFFSITGTLNMDKINCSSPGGKSLILSKAKRVVIEMAKKTRDKELEQATEDLPNEYIEK